MAIIEIVNDKVRKHKRPKVQGGIQGQSTDMDDSDSYSDSETDTDEDDDGIQGDQSTKDDDGGIQGDHSTKDDNDDSDSNSCGYDDGRYDIDEDDVSSVDYEDESISEEDNQVFRRYLKQIKISRGFDVDIFPRRVIGGLHPVDINTDFYIDKVKKCAEFAIKWHNRKKPEQLEFVRALKAIEGSTVGYMFFITLEAKVISSGKIKIYQAKVQDNFLSKKMILYIFRPKPGQD